MNKKNELNNTGKKPLLTLLTDNVPPETSVAVEIETSNIPDAHVINPPKSIGTILPHIFEKMKTYETAGGVTGIPTGFTKLNEITNGFQGGDLIIISGHPSMGKTSFCLSIALRAAIKAKCPTAVYSLQMSENRVSEQLLCMEAMVNPFALRGGTLPKRDYPKLSLAAGSLTNAPLYIDSTPGITISELKNKIKWQKKHNNLEFVIIDNLQLINSDVNGYMRHDISQISHLLKGMAIEFNIPMVVVSQLPRENERRVDHRPRLSDLPGNGAIEQDADIVMFVYRDELYDFDNQENRGEMEIIVAKQRNGPIGTVKAAFFKDYARVGDISGIADMPGFDDNN